MVKGESKVPQNSDSTGIGDGSSGCSLGRLSSSGAELVEGEPGLLPETSWVRMTDLQEALALALGGEGLSFYSALEEKGKKRGEET